MFYHINGVVTDIEPNLVVLECGGVGYALNASLNTISSVKTGERVKLYTYEIIREDVHDLYGFASKSEKHCFELLLAISGVGPKAALAILSSTSPERFTLAIMTQDEKTLTAAQGVGKKLAQRIILELKDKLGASQLEPNTAEFAGSGIPARGSKSAEATAALVGLGYSQAEAAAALKGIDLEHLSIEDVIRRALRAAAQQ